MKEKTIKVSEETYIKVKKQAQKEQRTIKAVVDRAVTVKIK